MGAKAATGGGWAPNLQVQAKPCPAEPRNLIAFARPSSLPAHNPAALCSLLSHTKRPGTALGRSPPQNFVGVSNRSAGPLHLQGCPHAAFHPPSSPPPSPPSLLLLPLLPSRRHCHHSSLLLPPLPSLAASRLPPLPHPRRSAEPQPPPAAPRKLEEQEQVPVACGNELQMVLFSTHRCEIAPPLGGLHTTSMPCTSSCWGTPNPWAHCLGATALVTTTHLC